MYKPGEGRKVMKEINEQKLDYENNTLYKR
jgi:hypothetical protein